MGIGDIRNQNVVGGRMALLGKSKFMKLLFSKCSCIIVKRQGKYHVRDYKRPVKHGMPRLTAELYAQYGNLPCNIPKLFKEGDNGIRTDNGTRVHT